MVGQAGECIKLRRFLIRTEEQKDNRVCGQCILLMQSSMTLWYDYGTIMLSYIIAQCLLRLLHVCVSATQRW